MWEFGPPRNVTLRPVAPPPQRTMTPFNYVVGGLVLTQYTRRPAACPYTNGAAVGVLTSQFSCQAPAVAGAPFGEDPAFLPSSPLYDGRLAPADYYAADERAPGGVPYGFCPQRWGQGGAPAPAADRDAGQFKLFFDGRLGQRQARRLAKYMRDGGFIGPQTDWVEAEAVAYNADYNLFGILTVQFRWGLGGGTLWGYQYNTAILSLYEGARGRASLGLDAAAGALLVADALRELREARLALLRGDPLREYLLHWWTWVAWVHVRPRPRLPSLRARMGGLCWRLALCAILRRFAGTVPEKG